MCTTSFLFTWTAPEVTDVNQINHEVSTVLDEMGRVGASPDQTPISRVSLGGASIIPWTMKDPSAFEKEAYVQAINKSRPIADDITSPMKVQIYGD